MLQGINQAKAETKFSFLTVVFKMIYGFNF